MTAASGDRLPKIGGALGLVAAAIGALGFLGWLLGNEALTSVVPGRPTMMPDTCGLLVLAGIAAALRAREGAPRWQKGLSICAGALITAVSGAIVFEYIFGVELGVDQILLRATTPGPFPGRPSPPTAMALAMLGGALLLFDVVTPRGRRPQQWLSLGAAMVIFPSFVGHIYGSDPFFRLARAPFIGVALHTAIAILLIAAGTLLVRPRSGIMRAVTGEGPGSMIVRQLGLASVLTPVVTGLLLTHVLGLVGMEEPQFLLTILTTAMVVIGTALVLLAARPLDRSHDALEASRAWFRELLEQAPDGIFLADIEGRYTDVNSAGCRLLQRSREEIIGKTIMDLLPPGEVDRLLQSKEEMLQGGGHVAEWRLLRKDGTLVPVEVSARILPDGRWQGFTRDLTQRIAQDEEVHRWKERLDRIISTAADAIVSIDDEQRITMFNQGAEHIFGWTKDEALGQPISILIPEQLRESHDHDLKGFMAEPAKARRMAERLSVFGLRKNGETFPAEAAISTVRSASGSVYTVILRDITAQEKYLAEQEYFSRVGEVLASTLDHREMMRLVARASVPFLGDVCGVLLAGDETLGMELFHANPALLPVVQTLERFGLPEQSLLRRSFETREPVLAPDLSPDHLQKIAHDAQHLQLLQALHVRSVIAVPLLAHGRCRGAICFSSASPARRYGPDDLRLAQEAGRRFALAVDNAVLHEELRLQATIAAHLNEGVVLIRDDDWRIAYANPRFEEMFGYAPRELIGKHVAAINAPGAVAPEETAEAIIGGLRRTGTWNGEVENVKKDGTRFWSYSSVSSFDHPQFGKVWVSVHTDISERKRLEEERARSLREKEVLLKEIHHRVKNNLQVISSLLYLQSRRSEDAGVREVLEESRGRVQSIALVHDQLCRSENLAAIELDRYLRNLVAGIEATYGARGIRVEVSARGVSLDIERAVPCGLLVSELVSNAFKHAFPGDRRGKVLVSAREEGGTDIVIEVADDGVGIPPDIDPRRSKTLGLQLVQSLTQQLRGSLAQDSSNGTRVTVRFQLRTSTPPGSQRM